MENPPFWWYLHVFTRKGDFHGRTVSCREGTCYNLIAYQPMMAFSLDRTYPAHAIWIGFFAHLHLTIPSMYGIFTYLVDCYGKCGRIHHTWMIWDLICISWSLFQNHDMFCREKGITPLCSVLTCTPKKYLTHKAHQKTDLVLLSGDVILSTNPIWGAQDVSWTAMFVVRVAQTNIVSEGDIPRLSHSKSLGHAVVLGLLKVSCFFFCKGKPPFGRIYLERVLSIQHANSSNTVDGRTPALCTTFDVQNLENSWTLTISTGAGFFPSTVRTHICFLAPIFLPIAFFCGWSTYPSPPKVLPWEIRVYDKALVRETNDESALIKHIFLGGVRGGVGWPVMNYYPLEV